MRLHLTSALFLLTATSLFACSGAAPADPSGASAEDLSAASTVPSPTSAGGVHRDPICPEDKKICILRQADGLCGPVCVSDTVLCGSDCKEPPSAASGEGVSSSAAATNKRSATGGRPTSAAGHPICDPDGPAPHAGCSWDEQTCEWACPICDPVGKAPHEGCTWSETSCEWQCPICDPVGRPPHEGCTWSETTCDWQCPVCDPPSTPPPASGCQWDPTACVWICG